MCTHYVVYKSCNRHFDTKIVKCAACKASGSCPSGPKIETSNAGEPCTSGCPSPENMPPRTFKPYSKAAPRNSPIVSDGTSRVEQDILWASVQMKGFGARGEFRTGSDI
ncbi:hypothetical protein QC760_003075 [Botrytis cinerea]